MEQVLGDLFVSVNDVSRVLIKVLNAENKIVRNQIFNVGGNKENYRIMDIINTIKKYIPISYEFSKKMKIKEIIKYLLRKLKKF